VSDVGDLNAKLLLIYETLICIQTQIILHITYSLLDTNQLIGRVMLTSAPGALVKEAKIDTF